MNNLLDYQSFDSLQNELQRCYQSGEYATAFDLATRYFDRFIEQQTLLYYWRITMAARSHSAQASIELLRQALDQGVWFSETLLRRSPSLVDLQQNPQFEALIARSLAMQQLESHHPAPLFTLRPEGKCARGAAPCPTLIGLHANAASAQTSMGFWRPIALAGWLVAAPQSTQAVWKGAYVWDDRSQAEAEIRRHLEAIKSNYATDEQNTLIAGHSMGGEVAIWLSLTGRLGFSGFLAIGPGGLLMDAPDEWQELIEAKTRPVRGYIILGENDQSIPQENIHQFVSTLNEASIPCQIEMVAGAGHDYSPAYDAALQHATQFLTQGHPKR